jgi:hypothetical protein
MICQYVEACSRIVVGKPGGEKPLGSLRCRWKYNIKTDLRRIGWDDINWIHVSHDREEWRALVDTAMNFQVP